MSSFSKSTEFQATNAVNSLIKRILPGMQKIAVHNKDKKKSKFKQKGSTAQFIDRNLKESVELNEKNVFLSKKRERKVRKQENKSKRAHNEKLEQQARLQLLVKHQAEGTLTDTECDYLSKLTKRNVLNAKAWDLDEDDEDESIELQRYILEKLSESQKDSRSLNRRKRVKLFKEEIKEKANTSLERKYPGLTPGLAPVGLSDEESSDDE